MKNSTLDYASAKKIIPFFNKKLGIEYFPGDKRFVGTPHERELKICYGHIRGYVGADKETLDCYVSPSYIADPSNVGLVFEIEQLDGDGNFDEHKYMIGFFTELEAKEAYLSEMPEDRFGGIKAVDTDHIEKNKRNYVFSEQDLKTRINDKYNSLSDTEKPDFMASMVYEIVDENYGGKIQNFKILEKPKAGYIISGGFETPRMGGKKLIMGFDIDDSKIVLAPQNLEVLNNSESGSLYLLSLGLVNSFSEKANYYPIEFFDFAQKQMNCTVGWSCKGENGYACLSKTKKNCNNNLNPNHKTYISWLKDQIRKGAKLHKGHMDEAKALGIIKPTPTNKPNIKPTPTNKPNIKPTPTNKPNIKPTPTNKPDINPTSTVKPDDNPAPKSPQNDGKFPDNLDSLVVVKKLGGTTGAKLVKDPATGKQYVMKNGSSAKHLENEAIGDSAYQALGINVPSHKLYKNPNGKDVKLAEYVEGRDLAEIMKNGTQQEKDLIKSEIKKHFAADALLGNWDVVGLEKDNIMLGNDGKVYRIDNGGSLGYRAQGAKKDPKFWNKYPLDLWSMRDKSINPDGAEYFGDLTHKEVVNQINDLVSKKDKLKGIFSKEDQEIIDGRIEEMKRVADISKTLDEDKWNDDYIGNFTKHTVGTRAAGITDKLPNKFKQKSTNSIDYYFTTMVDEKGNDFDNLRGKNSIVSDLKEYMGKNKGDFTIITEWATQQASDSWNDIPQAVKYFFANQRNISKDSYYWRNGESSAGGNYEILPQSPPKGFGWNKKTVDETLTAMHAFTYEMLSKADIPNKNQDGTITLIRTEDKDVTDLYNLKPGDTGKIDRGAMESTSLVRETYVGTATEVTVQKVPIHRIFGTYFNSRTETDNKGMFAGNSENEFVAMLEGVSVYHKSSDY